MKLIELNCYAKWHKRWEVAKDGDVFDGVKK